MIMIIYWMRRRKNKKFITNDLILKKFVKEKMKKFCEEIK